MIMAVGVQFILGLPVSGSNARGSSCLRCVMVRETSCAEARGGAEKPSATVSAQATARSRYDRMGGLDPGGGERLCRWGRQLDQLGRHGVKVGNGREGKVPIGFVQPHGTTAALPARAT